MRRASVLLTTLLIGTAIAVPARAVDPFYDNLLAEGRLDFARGDFNEASRLFRIACFGMLDEPDRLADCRVRLALSEAELGRREEFEETFRRILDLERRFDAYTRAEIPAEVRSEFEGHVERWVPEEMLRDVPAFEPLLRQRTLDRIARLPPAQRRIEVEQLAASEPTEPRWPLELARMEVADRSWLTAQEWAQRALDLAPGDDEALCLRGRAAAIGARCSEALADLAHCSDPPSDQRLAEDRLSCHLALGDLDGAERFIASLPPEMQETRSIRKVGKGIAKAREQAAREAARSAAADGADDEPVAAPAAEGTFPSQDGDEDMSSAELRRLRATLLAATDYATLTQLYRRAEELAQASPDWIAAQRLAGEAAYRTSQWERSVHFLRRSRLDTESPPALGFYLAVALYESGERDEAARVLRQVLPRLEGSPLVRSYRDRILGEGG